MKRIQQLFLSIVERIENDTTPLRRYIFLFFAILTMRLCLEFFSNHKLYNFLDILHIGLWFTFIVLAFMLQLHLFSGEQLTKIIKLGVTCFSIALSAPIIDLIVARGEHFKMNYLFINNLHDLLYAYFTIGGASLTRGATIGIRIEIVLLLIACFNYVYQKKRSVIRASLASWCIYTVLFFSGTVPYLLGLTTSSLHLQYATDDRSTLLFLFLFDFVLLSAIIARLKIQTLRALDFYRHGVLLLIAVVYFIIGVMAALRGYPDNWNFNPTTLFWFPLLVLLFMLFYIYYTLFTTVKIHDDNNKNYYDSNAFLLLIMVTSGMISYKCFFSSMIIWALLFLLYEAPLFLHRVPYLSVLLKSLFPVAFLIVGFTSFGGPMVGIDYQLILGIIFINIVMIFVGEKLITNESSFFKLNLRGEIIILQVVYLLALALYALIEIKK